MLCFKYKWSEAKSSLFLPCRPFLFSCVCHLFVVGRLLAKRRLPGLPTKKTKNCGWEWRDLVIFHQGAVMEKSIPSLSDTYTPTKAHSRCVRVSQKLSLVMGLSRPPSAFGLLGRLRLRFILERSLSKTSPERSAETRSSNSPSSSQFSFALRALRSFSLCSFN